MGTHSRAYAFIKWGRPAGVPIHYEVFRSLDINDLDIPSNSIDYDGWSAFPGIKSFLINILTPRQLSLRDVTVPLEETVHYRVAAVDIHGTRFFSTVATVQTWIPWTWDNDVPWMFGNTSINPSEDDKITGHEGVLWMDEGVPDNLNDMWQGGVPWQGGVTWLPLI